MKKKFLARLCIAIAVLMACAFAFSGCFGNTPRSYVIQYTDDLGTHQLSVTEGMPYTLDSVPSRSGHTFLGLFDAEVGGTQYVSANGASLSAFNEGKNIVLFPRFEAKDYTLVLDYQGAAVTGNRQFTVTYGSKLPNLPTDISIAHNEFKGWYTETNCNGTLISDKYGLMPVVSVLNDTNFDLSDDYVYLYAGFEVEKFTVSFIFGQGAEPEMVQVPYNTPINEVMPTTRVDGNAVLTWSREWSGEVFNGRITNHITLYALEFAPVIEFNSDGGREVSPIVARAGDSITLPTPTKDLAKFSHWEDLQGNKYTSTTMPSKSTTLKAVWQGKLVFDENGGTNVEDISVAAGNKIILPTPERDGYVFAGWYTAHKEQYTSTTMPTVGIALKAGWYEEKTDTEVIISSTSNHDVLYSRPTLNDSCYTFNFNKYFSVNFLVNVKIDWHVKLKIDGSGSKTEYVDFYSKKEVSSFYLIKTQTFSNITNVYREFNFSTNFAIKDNFYICWYGTELHAGLYISDFYYTVHYPDMTNLYL